MACVIAIGASAGGVPALEALMAGLPADLPAAVLVVLLVGAHTSRLPALLSGTPDWRSNTPATAI